MPYTPTEVLDVLINRMEARVEILERCSSTGGYDGAIMELRKFAAMLKKARDYVSKPT